MNTTPPKIGDSSPWGQIQHLTILADGIVSVSTPSHGGIWLSPEREAMVPTYLRRAARQYAPVQWYEEDCDVCVVAVTFPEDFAGEPEFLNHSRACVSVDPRYQPGARLLRTFIA